MKLSHILRLKSALFGLCPLVLAVPSAIAGGITIISPQPNATMPGTVSINVLASESIPFHIELWDNGGKLGDYFSGTVNTSAALSKGLHNMIGMAVSNNGAVLDWNIVNFNVSGTAASQTGVNISSPSANGSSISAVTISASVSGSVDHLSIWDNGYKLGEVPGSSVNGVYVLPVGNHVMTVQAISASGSVTSSSNVNYFVVESCSNSRFAQCDLDQQPADNRQNDCNPAIEQKWVANPCGQGVQGINPISPLNTTVEQIYEGGTLQNLGNRTLTGYSMHLAETQGYNPSNVLFRGLSPMTTPGNAADSHWNLDEYVYLPDPAAHQAFEMDAQYTTRGVWSKFYTECAFNMNNGQGYWAVFDSSTGGWIFLNGTVQGGQGTPVVPCNRSQFSQPWANSSNPSFTGWHHISWTFQRERDGTVTFQTLTFDGTTTNVNFHPNSGTGGGASDNGNFSALVQLDGVVNRDLQHSVVDAYVSQVSLSHTP